MNEISAFTLQVFECSNSFFLSFLRLFASLCYSIVVHDRLGGSFPLEVCSVVFLRMPAVVWMHNIIAPAHGLSVGNGVDELAEAHFHIVERVLSARAPAHEW